MVSSMAEQESQQEPTMEEILASIRRIISEDDEEPVEDATVAAAEPEPEYEPQVEEFVEAPEEETLPPEPEEVLELTQKVNEDGSVSTMDAEEDMVEAAQEPETQVEDDLVLVDEQDVATDAGNPDEPLLSNEAAGAAAAYFGALAQNVQVSDGKANTLEHLVEEMLRPMLKGWLDQNLPAIVEELVREEIERLSRRGRLG